MKESLLVIVGPTATGKTSLAIEMAKRIPAEIISGDSMQIYRYMNIGTAKASKLEQEGIPHHLIDCLNPDEEFSVSIFQDKVTKLISGINAKNKLPILVGGTGLYVRSIIDHYNFSEATTDWELREHLQTQALEKGNEYLHGRLAEVDKAAADRIHPNDTRRIIRALEVYHHTGQTISESQDRDEHLEAKYNMLMYGLTMEREKLYDGINKRVDMMIDDGLINEVKNLLSRGFSSRLTSMQAIGYKEVIEYLEGKYTLEEAIEAIKQNTRRFAKRQLTWFRRDNRIEWLHIENKQTIANLAQQINDKVCNTIFKGVE